MRGCTCVRPPRRPPVSCGLACACVLTQGGFLLLSRTNSSIHESIHAFPVLFGTPLRVCLSTPQDGVTKRPLGARTTLGRTRVGRQGRGDTDITSPELANAHFLGVQAAPDSLWRVEDVLKGALSQSRFAVHQEILRVLQHHAPPDMPVLSVPNHIFPIPTLPNTFEEESNL